VKRTDHGNRTEISDAETVNETATATVVAETVIPIANAAVMATAIKTGLQSATENDQGSVTVTVTVNVIASALAAIDPRPPPAGTILKPVV
jgi:hypothetical protein